MAPTARPKTIEIRTYQMGFGDCFLLSFKYASYDRHMLIDFGSMALPKGAKKGHMVRIAHQIKKDCGGHLEVVAATHRHKDHISGFATNKSRTAPGNVIASCNPSIVIQPWTEDPAAAANATHAARPAVRAFTNSLDHMHGVAEAARRTARELRGAIDRQVLKHLSYLGQDNIKNRSAVENLMSMGTNYYVKHGDRLPLASLLPGVKVHVLGPPSLEQSDDISKQRHKDAEEFWHMQAAAGNPAAGNGEPLFPALARSRPPINARWFRQRLRSLRAEMMLSIVRTLDRQMNNTSLILLFETNGKFLLFPGDAQIENWSYALGQEEIRKLLRQVAVYKVGHHGSLNATPKTLWNLFEKRDSAETAGRLKSLLSTKADVHGHEEAGTEVPRSKLVNALRKDSEFLSTQSYDESEICRVVRLEI